MKKFVSRVTVTGADDSVSPHHLLEIFEQFPFVEFGILISRNSMGNTRFPSREWIKNLIQMCDGSGIQFAGHICGSWVRELLMGHWPSHDFMNIDDDFMSPGMFKRWQINTHAQPHKADLNAVSDILTQLKRRGQSVIFQNDNVNTHLMNPQLGTNISALFDLSHGTGILPAEWPKPLEGIDCGYAGGLSPDNVAEQLTKLESIIGDAHIWIDAETLLRSDNDLQFDLQKVITFLKAAEPWVIESELHHVGEAYCPECNSFNVEEISYENDFGSMHCIQCDYQGGPGEDFPAKI